MNKKELFKDDPGRKITKKDVEKIRALIGKMPNKQIAYIFGISNGYVSRIKSNNRRKNQLRGDVCSKCGKDL